MDTTALVIELRSIEQAARNAAEAEESGYRAPHQIRLIANRLAALVEQLGPVAHMVDVETMLREGRY